MAVTLSQIRRFTADEYLEIEARSIRKSEYLDGCILSMAGGSLKHSALTANASTLLSNSLREEGCTVLSSDTRVSPDPEGTYLYPDVSVICGEAEVLQKYGETLLNPILLVEVLSPSTSDWDRTTKLKRYMEFSSARAILMIEQNSPTVHVTARASDTSPWRSWIVTELESVLELENPPLSVPLSELYRDLLG